MNLKICVIAAACENMGIGYKGSLPWRLRKEMSYFSKITKAVDSSDKINAVIMGRRTWDSIPQKFRPLPGRRNIVLSRSKSPIEGALLYSSWEEAIQDLQTEVKFENIEKLWVIGGSSLYTLAMNSSLCNRIYLTRILAKFDCDVFFPEIDIAKFHLVKDQFVPEDEQEEDGVRFRYEVYELT